MDRHELNIGNLETLFLQRGGYATLEGKGSGPTRLFIDRHAKISRPSGAFRGHGGICSAYYILTPFGKASVDHLKGFVSRLVP